MTNIVEKTFRFVTAHNVLVLLLLLLVTAGVAAGTTQLRMQSEGDGRNAVGDTEVAQKLEYVRDAYNTQNGSADSERRPAAVYVRSEENALSKPVLVETLEFQQTVLENESVGAALGDRAVFGVANLIAERIAGDPQATLTEQISALEDARRSEVNRAVERTLTKGSPALNLLPEEYEPGTATARSHRMVFRFADVEERSAATAALYEAANERSTTSSEQSNPEYFTAGEHARAAANATYLQNTMELVVPVALLVILAVLAFSYRDLVDVIVGFTGVVLSVLWMFGILGWLQIPAGVSIIIGPVLIVGLSVDYGLHVFMRYREQRGDEEGIREPMARGLSSVTVALGLVTLTAMVGFMSNATNEFTVIRQLAFAITLGVLSTFVVSLTLVPALKVTIDSLLERIGLDRRSRPLGKNGMLEPVLASGATLAKRAAPVVIVLALVAGSAGAVAWTDLDRQSIQQNSGDIADWKQDLPEPLAWDVAEESTQMRYVSDHYRAADEDARSRSNVLVEGDVTSSAALASIQTIHDTADTSDVAYQKGDTAPVTSPLSVMAAVAESDESFAKTFKASDTDHDGVPDRNIEAVYDALYATAPDRASQVIDREGGEYRSLRAIVPIQPDVTTTEQANGMQEIATAVDGHDGVSAIAVGSGTLSEAERTQTAESILETLVIALLAVGVLLTLVYRVISGSASLGAVTAVPITLVSALVIGGMWVFDVPLTLLTALLLSLVIGIGIDYNIHISDRFAQERERGQPVQEALVEATTGTGGALLGSTLTSAGAFSALILHPDPQFQSFGLLVVLAMVTSFVVAVFVLPSMIATWARYGPSTVVEGGAPSGDAISSDD